MFIALVRRIYFKKNGKGGKIKMVWKKEKTGVVDYLWSKQGKSSMRGSMEVWAYKTRDISFC